MSLNLKCSSGQPVESGGLYRRKYKANPHHAGKPVVSLLLKTLNVLNVIQGRIKYLIGV